VEAGFGRTTKPLADEAEGNCSNAADNTPAFAEPIRTEQDWDYSRAEKGQT